MLVSGRFGTKDFQTFSMLTLSFIFLGLAILIVIAANFIFSKLTIFFDRVATFQIIMVASTTIFPIIFSLIFRAAINFVGNMHVLEGSISNLFFSKLCVKMQPGAWGLLVGFIVGLLSYILIFNPQLHIQGCFTMSCNIYPPGDPRNQNISESHDVYLLPDGTGFTYQGSSNQILRYHKWHQTYNELYISYGVSKNQFLRTEKTKIPRAIDYFFDSGYFMKLENKNCYSLFLDQYTVQSGAEDRVAASSVPGGKGVW